MGEYLQLQREVNSNDISILSRELKSISDVNLTWGSGINILHYYISNANSLNYSPEEIIRTMKEAGVNINAVNSNGASPLHFAVAHPKPELAKELIKRGAEVDIKDKMGNTPLWRAVMNYRAKAHELTVIQELLVGGANPDMTNNSGNSPRSLVLSAHKNFPIIGDPIEWDLQPILKW